jgi:hypothetical protein
MPAASADNACGGPTPPEGGRRWPDLSVVWWYGRVTATEVGVGVDLRPMCAVALCGEAAAMSARIVGGFVFGAVLAGWIGRALFKWALGLTGTQLAVLMVATAAAGGVLGIAGALEERRR